MDVIRDESMRALTNNPPALKEVLFTTGGTGSDGSGQRGRGRGCSGRGGRGRWDNKPMEPSGAPTASGTRTTPKTAGLDLTTMTTTETVETLRNVGSVESLDIFNKTVLFAKRGERQYENLKGASRTIRNLPT